MKKNQSPKVDAIADGDFYSINGEKYDRVSRVLDAVGTKTIYGAEEAMKNAGIFGTEVHAILAEGLKIKRDGMESDYKKYVDGLHFSTRGDITGPVIDCAMKGFRWVDQNVKKIIDVEITRSDKKWRFAGTIDLIFILKGEKTFSLLDWKTGIPNWWRWSMQTAGYNILYPKAKYRYIVILPKNEKDETARRFESSIVDSDLFFSLVKIHRSQEQFRRIK